MKIEDIKIGDIVTFELNGSARIKTTNTSNNASSNEELGSRSFLCEGKVKEIQSDLIITDNGSFIFDKVVKVEKL